MLESLELRENLIKGLPESIRSLTKLERLDLGDNEIEVLPPYLGYLPSLQELWLDSNKLQRLPPEIGRLASLTCLDVSNNRWALHQREKCAQRNARNNEMKAERKNSELEWSEWVHILRSSGRNNNKNNNNHTLRGTCIELMKCSLISLKVTICRHYKVCFVEKCV